MLPITTALTVTALARTTEGSGVERHRAGWPAVRLLTTVIRSAVSALAFVGTVVLESAADRADAYGSGLVADGRR